MLARWLEFRLLFSSSTVFELVSAEMATRSASPRPGAGQAADADTRRNSDQAESSDCVSSDSEPSIDNDIDYLSDLHLLSFIEPMYALKEGAKPEKADLSNRVHHTSHLTCACRPAEHFSDADFIRMAEGARR